MQNARNRTGYMTLRWLNGTAGFDDSIPVPAGSESVSAQLEPSCLGSRTFNSGKLAAKS